MQTQANPRRASFVLYSRKISKLKCLILSSQRTSYEKHSSVYDFKAGFPSKFVDTDKPFGIVLNRYCVDMTNSKTTGLQRYK